MLWRHFTISVFKRKARVQLSFIFSSEKMYLSVRAESKRKRFVEKGQMVIFKTFVKFAKN